jgi:RimJ/RimL family protein N-acetyltransferase
MNTTVRDVPASFHDLLLHTGRLCLRPLAETDAPALFGLFSDPEVMRYWSTSPWTQLEQAQAMIADAAEGVRSGRHLRLAATQAETGQLIGTCSLFNLYRSSQRAEIGYALGRAFWGQGLMHEALSALVAMAFGDWGLRRLEADIDPRNTASARALERLGFREEGLLRERWVVNGEVSDSGLYGLLAAEWRARQPR